MNFPGGKREEGETMEDCVRRETLEETGLVIENPVQVGYVEFPRFDFTFIYLKARPIRANFRKIKMKLTLSGRILMISICGNALKLTGIFCRILLPENMLSAVMFMMKILSCLMWLICNLNERKAFRKLNAF